MKPPVHHVQVRPGPLPGVHAVLMHSARGFGRHWHDSFGFGVMDEGAHRTASGRGPVLATAGQVIATNPGEVHDGVPMGESARRWRMVHVSLEAMAAMADLRPGHEIAQPVFDDPLLQAAIRRVFGFWSSDGAAPDAALWEEALTGACGLIVQRHGNRPPNGSATGLDHQALARVRECLLDGLDAPPGLDALARLANLSRFQLVRHFARAHGLPPFAWLQQQRLGRARTLIAAGTPLSEAAQACGFADQSHLHRHFLRCFGYTPGAWQRAWLQ
ncbi:AraC family transcriptional regulator [Hydrogenophaga sp.]|uniref:AraC family transcriptional regulator n=1 Tax=Hydrogenophaga sp. TaxID=1904254 RepID=UPI0025B7C8F8|nr:AraC family transcriptional regulator [Hydrogenophaga sp.]